MSGEIPKDIPLVFRVTLATGEKYWGVAAPEIKDHGSQVVLLNGEGRGFGWWYRSQTLRDALDRIFRRERIERIEEMSITLAEVPSGD